ncbi:hypothetical protein ACFQY4_10785 [Catellatospora bangladeshensis]|uniref:Uncharacterized protein n=1 Tax=Catellatospora bangladeshensis TaxID=310355 RepID=A0A8J3NI24_9ACTN|nr:hypothetical protein [Catellatospora bangladeshensis]GIF81747.1 hypothetical protein Cba03nite_30960 [Catellatospora bangladeshensis]
MTELFDAHDQAASERRLDDAFAQRATGDPLAELLMRAAAPGRPEEHAGAETVLAAFRAAYPSPVTRPGRTLRRALTLKVAALVAALTVGGVAFATGTGVLPNPFPIGPQQDPGDSPSAAHSSRGSAPSATPTPTPGPSSSLSPSALPGTSLPANAQGLCRSFLATAEKDKPKATDSPEYAALVAAAGDQDLTTFCEALLANGGQPGGDPATSLDPSQVQPSPVQPSKAHPSKSPKENGAPARASQTPRAPGRGFAAPGSSTDLAVSGQVRPVQ